MMHDFVSRFWDALERSIIVQSTVTLILVIAVVYMSIAGKPIDELIKNLTLIVVSFWMGTKVEHRAHELAGKSRENC